MIRARVLIFPAYALVWPVAFAAHIMNHGPAKLASEPIFDPYFIGTGWVMWVVCVAATITVYRLYTTRERQTSLHEFDSGDQK